MEPKNKQQIRNVRQKNLGLEFLQCMLFDSCRSLLLACVDGRQRGLNREKDLRRPMPTDAFEKQTLFFWLFEKRNRIEN